MLSQKEKQKIRQSNYETLLVRKEHLESVLKLLDEMAAHSYKGYNLFEVQKELDYILDVLAFDFTPKR